MLLVIWSLCVFCASIASGYDQYSKSSGSNTYLEVLVDRIEELVNNGECIDLSKLKVRKINKTRSFVGDILLKCPLGDDVIMEGIMLAKQGGEYRLMPYRLPPSPFCTFCVNDTYVYPDLAKNSDFPEDIENNCPLQAKSYSIQGVAYRLENLPRSMMHSGDYALEAIFTRNETILNKFRIYATIIQI